MPFDLAYDMTTGSGISFCPSALDALVRHRELRLAGASGIVVTKDGLTLTLAELEVLSGADQTAGR